LYIVSPIIFNIVVHNYQQQI